jgi:16S rRNA (cytosine967-C5)-methyltransferase
MQTDEPTFPSTRHGNHFRRYLDYATSILKAYTGDEPLHIFIKKYFSSNKKHGSKDRKIISSFCYNYFRLGQGATLQEISEKLLLSSYLCEKNPSLILEVFKPQWNKNVHLEIQNKIRFVSEEFDLQKVFPFPDELTDELDLKQFNLSFLIQPKFFLRIRPGYRDLIINKIRNKGLEFEELDLNCFAFPRNEKLDGIIDLDRQAVVQDYNSQKTLDLVKEMGHKLNSPLTIWDCCAGSGGKSILAFDIFENIKLSVSDSRKNILHNLRNRFGKAGIKNYELFLSDLQKPNPNLKNTFDIIIADVPCSGSGTWSRTPEQLIFFSRIQSEKHVITQRKIIENSIPHLKVNGHLLYITCSVFKRENEENAAFFQQQFHLNLLKMEYLKGYEYRADTMCVALFEKVV